MPSTQTHASDLGAISNRLGLLTKDFSKFYPSKLVEVTGLPKAELARKTSLSRPTLHKAGAVELTPKIRQNILDLVMATDLAWDLLGKNDKEAERWMVAPNTIFGGYSPLEICLRGDGKDLIAWLNTRLGRIDGPLF